MVLIQKNVKAFVANKCSNAGVRLHTEMLHFVKYSLQDNHTLNGTVLE